MHHSLYLHFVTNNELHYYSVVILESTTLPFINKGDIKVFVYCCMAYFAYNIILGYHSYFLKKVDDVFDGWKILYVYNTSKIHTVMEYQLIPCYGFHKIYIFQAKINMSTNFFLMLIMRVLSRSVCVEFVISCATVAPEMMGAHH